jgi:hypothetical protein
MRRTILALLVTGLLGGAVFGLSGCYATSASVGVEAGTPAPYYAYDPYYGNHVFIDGHWTWTAHGWDWYPGYWVGARPGFVYVQGYWDYWGSHYYWRPGLWARYRGGRVWIGNRWHSYRPGYRHYDYRRGTWVTSRGYRGYRGYRGVRDHRTYRDNRSYRARPGVRDHRGGGYRYAPRGRVHRRR